MPAPINIDLSSPQALLNSLGLTTESFGTKPDVAAPTPLNLREILGGNLDANQAAAPAATRLAGDINRGNMTNLLDTLESAAPGIRNTLSRTSALINEDLANPGGIPTDVANSVSTAAAERAVQGGFAGSRVAEGLTLRDLGLTSMQLREQRLTRASNFLTTMKAIAGEQVSAGSLLTSPDQALKVAETNATADQAFRQSQANVAAAPSPFAAFGINLLSTVLGQQNQAQLNINAQNNAAGNQANASNTAYLQNLRIWKQDSSGFYQVNGYGMRVS